MSHPGNAPGSAAGIGANLRNLCNLRFHKLI